MSRGIRLILVVFFACFTRASRSIQVAASDQGLIGVAFESTTSDKSWDSDQCNNYKHRLVARDTLMDQNQEIASRYRNPLFHDIAIRGGKGQTAGGGA